VRVIVVEHHSTLSLSTVYYRYYCYLPTTSRSYYTNLLPRIFQVSISPLDININHITTHPTTTMPSFHITEPHPSAGAYIYSGRGGAGNVTRISPNSLTNGATASGPASRVKLSPPPVTAYFASGRGGAGNMRTSKERAMFSFDEELQQQERLRSQQAPVYHVGRGGAGNLVDEMKPQSQRQNSAGSMSSVESDKDGVRRSMERQWQKLSRKYSS
jgi:hypothetical protein